MRLVVRLFEQRGLISSGHVRPPLIEPTDAGLEKIRQLMTEGEQYLSPVAGYTVDGHTTRGYTTGGS